MNSIRNTITADDLESLVDYWGDDNVVNLIDTRDTFVLGSWTTKAFDATAIAYKLRIASAKAFAAVRILGVYYHDAVAQAAARYNLSLEELTDAIEFEIAMEMKAFERSRALTCMST